MPLQAVRHIAKAQNGVGHFILQCKRLTFHYCDWHGSSRGLNAFLSSPLLRDFARANPAIEINVSPRPGQHPVIRGEYMNGRQKAICVRGMTAGEVLGKATLLRDASGERLTKAGRAGRQVVRSANESVRGVWDPYHRKEPFQL